MEERGRGPGGEEGESEGAGYGGKKEVRGPGGELMPSVHA